MSKVAILKCEDYSFDNLYESIKKGVELTGGFSFTKGKKVLLKPNLLAPVKAEDAVTTHPLFVKAVIRLLKEAGATVFVGDSPGIGTQENIYKLTGIKDVVEEEGAEIANFKEKIEVKFHEGKMLKSITLAKAYEDVDYIFTLPKLKTHGMTYYTGAIKNLFGMIPGLLKPKLHYRYPNLENFSDMLIDINLLLKPVYAIMDGVVAMEGNGPRNGDPVNLGLILVSKDLVAIDTVACKIIGINPFEIVPIVKGNERSLGNMSDIEVLGEDIKELNIKPFKQIKKELDIGRILPLPKFIDKMVKELLLPKPKLIEKKCVHCRECINVCPVDGKAVDMINGRIEFDREKCIRCFCCQEMCPVGAIEAKRFVRR